MAVINDRTTDLLIGAASRMGAGRDPFVPEPGDIDFLRERRPSHDEVVELKELLAIGAKLLLANAGADRTDIDFVRNPALSNLRSIGVFPEHDADAIVLTVARVKAA